MLNTFTVLSHHQATTRLWLCTCVSCHQRYEIASVSQTDVSRSVTFSLSSWSARFFSRTDAVPLAYMVHRCSTGAGHKASCGHIAPAEVNSEKLSDEKAEEQFLRWFDVTTGTRRLTCKSRLEIPEDPQHSARAQDWTGMLAGCSVLTAACALRRLCTAGVSIALLIYAALIIQSWATARLFLWNVWCRRCCELMCAIQWRHGNLGIRAGAQPTHCV
jgi:hypothetical protein